MTEKEKMLKGYPYFSMGSELFGERQRAKVLVDEFNELSPEQYERRNEVLRGLLNKTGERFYFEPPFRCDYGYNIEIGEDFYSNYNLIILDCAPVRIGCNAFIAPNVGIYTAGHPISSELRNKGIEYAKEVNIGDNVWIGANTIINPGVSIGSNVVIGSGSVVTRDIPDNVVAAGNPCRVIREITEDENQYFFKKEKLSDFPDIDFTSVF